VAPHSFKSRIQLGIEAHNKKKLEEHARKLERMYLAAPCNQHYEPGIRVSDGEAEVVISIQEKFLDAAGSVHESVCCQAMSDAARLAVSSLVAGVVISTVSFNFLLSRPVAEGDLIARGRFMGMSENHYLAESVLADPQGQEIGRGTGAFAQSQVSLSAEMGYR
jgi:acyl-coenzyme A thioesterase PaaI-like protein